MDAFNYRDGELFAEGVALSAIAERFGTPTYVYSRAHIEAQYRAYADALSGMPHMVCFAVKANSNLGVAQCPGAPRRRFRHRLAWRAGACAGGRW